MKNKICSLYQYYEIVFYGKFLKLVYHFEIGNFKFLRFARAQLFNIDFLHFGPILILGHQMLGYLLVY